MELALTMMKKYKGVIFVILAVVVMITLSSCATKQDELDPAEKVAVDFWKAYYIHFDKSKLEKLLTSHNHVDTDTEPVPMLPGTIWITSFDYGQNSKLVWIYVSPELLNGYRKPLYRVGVDKENGQWKVTLVQDDFDVRNNFTFEAFKETTFYKENFGGAEWKEVTIDDGN
jgi:hypothetical protein